MPKFYAPYKKFRTVVDGITLLFPQGSRFVPDDNEREIAAIKKIPIELGEIKDAAGEVVNLPVDATFTEMKVAQLVEYAKEEGINLTGLRKKDEIIHAIMKSLEDDTHN